MYPADRPPDARFGLASRHSESLVAGARPPSAGRSNRSVGSGGRMAAAPLPAAESRVTGAPIVVPL